MISPGDCIVFRSVSFRPHRQVLTPSVGFPTQGLSALLWGSMAAMLDLSLFSVVQIQIQDGWSGRPESMGVMGKAVVLWAEAVGGIGSPILTNLSTPCTAKCSLYEGVKRRAGVARLRFKTVFWSFKGKWKKGEPHLVTIEREQRWFLSTMQAVISWIVPTDKEINTHLFRSII